MRRIASIVVALTLVAWTGGVAQVSSPRVPTAADSVFTRARTLVVNGNGGAGRVLVDSMLAATTPGTPLYADALYWRATLAETSADAEADYRRIVVEYPLSPHEGDALLQLAQLEVARGDRASAETHLERFLNENPTSADANRAELMLVRVSFDRNDLPRGCMALYRALGAVPDSAVELHNQLTYYQPRCSGVDTTHFLQPVLPAATAAVVPSGVETDTSQIASAPSRDSTASDSTPRDSARTAHTRAPRSARPEHADSSAAKPHGKYTLQVAAYTSKSDAEHLAKKLSARGLEARVVGTSTLYRVRIGRYETRAEAGAAAKALKDKKIDAFVTEAGPSDP